MSDGYLDAINKNTAEIRTCAYELESLANAFYVTGNTDMDDKLSEIAKILHTSSIYINNAVGEEINNNLQRSYKGVADTFEALLQNNSL